MNILFSAGQNEVICTAAVFESCSHNVLVHGVIVHVHTVRHIPVPDHVDLGPISQFRHIELKVFSNVKRNFVILSGQTVGDSGH